MQNIQQIEKKNTIYIYTIVFGQSIVILNNTHSHENITVTQKNIEHLGGQQEPNSLSKIIKERERAGGSDCAPRQTLSTLRIGIIVEDVLKSATSIDMYYILVT